MISNYLIEAIKAKIQKFVIHTFPAKINTLISFLIELILVAIYTKNVKGGV